MIYLTDTANRIRAQIPDTLVPGDSDDLFVIYALLAEVVGLSTTSKDVHDAWVAWMVIRGEDHSSMVPFEDLPADVRSKDEPFVSAIRGVAREST